MAIAESVPKLHTLNYNETTFTAAADYTSGDVCRVGTQLGFVLGDIDYSEDSTGVAILRADSITVTCKAQSGSSYYAVGSPVFIDYADNEVTYDDEDGANPYCGFVIDTVPADGAETVKICFTGCDLSAWQEYSGVATLAQIKAIKELVPGIPGLKVQLSFVRMQLNGATASADYVVIEGTSAIAGNGEAIADLATGNGADNCIFTSDHTETGWTLSDDAFTIPLTVNKGIQIAEVGTSDLTGVTDIKVGLRFRYVLS